MAGRSDETILKLQELREKYSDLCDDCSELSEPARSIVEFINLEGGS